MKSILNFLLILILSFQALAQGDLIINDETQVTSMESVVEVPGVSKDELYNRARHWVAQNFKSANDVLKMDDRTAGAIVLKAFDNIAVGSGIAATSVKMWFTLSIYQKEGRFKYVVEVDEYQGDLYPSSPSYDMLKWRYKKNGKERQPHMSYYTSSERSVKSTVASLSKTMSGTVVNTQEDW